MKGGHRDVWGYRLKLFGVCMYPFWNLKVYKRKIFKKCARRICLSLLTLNPRCNYGNDVESAIHFFLHCLLYSNERRTFLNSLVNIDHMLLDNADFSLTQILLFGNTTFNAIENTKIIILKIDLFCQLRDSMSHFYE